MKGLTIYLAHLKIMIIRLKEVEENMGNTHEFQHRIGVYIKEPKGYAKNEQYNI